MALMPCLNHTDPNGPAEHFVTPFADTDAVACPCSGGCAGVLKSDGRNVQNTLTFLQCDVCGCTYSADDSVEAAKLVETCRTQLAEALGLDLTGDMDWKWDELLDVVRREVDQLARIRRIV